MPPKSKLQKQDIIAAALDIVREKGIEALGARSLASKLGCSTQPIFSNFSSMEEIKDQVKLAAFAEYERRLHRDMRSGEYPPYKASGMSYIRFAREEKELFRLLYMSDRSQDDRGHEEISFDEIARVTAQNLNIDFEKAKAFHLQMWIYVHGLAAMAATSY